jgi:excisionase family DNA binding protein
MSLTGNAARKGDSMEKICIVKLRKIIADPFNSFDRGSAAEHESGAGGFMRLPKLGFGAKNAGEESAATGDPRSNEDATSHNVSLKLTRDQARALESDTHLRSYLHGEFRGEFGEKERASEPIVIKFEFESASPVRLLKPIEIMQMLRIGRTCLNRVVSKGALKSYKIGSRRRFMLDDVLSYLANSLDFQGSRQCDLKVKATQTGSL